MVARRVFTSILIGLAVTALAVVGTGAGAARAQTPPAANAGGPYACVPVGAPFQFFGNGSTGENLNYYWEFGDGGTAVGQNPAHTYTQLQPQGQPYQVTLRVTNEFGQSYDFTSAVAQTACGATPAASVAPNCFTTAGGVVCSGAGARTCTTTTAGVICSAFNTGNCVQTVNGTVCSGFGVPDCISRFGSVLCSGISTPSCISAFGDAIDCGVISTSRNCVSTLSGVVCSAGSPQTCVATLAGPVCSTVGTSVCSSTPFGVVCRR